MLRPVRIRYYTAAMWSRGFDVKAVLAGSGITHKQLTDPACLVDRRQCERVITNMISLTHNPALGLEMASYPIASDFGVVSYAMMSARTMRQAISIWKRFNNLVDLTIGTRLEEYPDRWEAIYDVGDLKPSIHHYCCEEALLLGVRMLSAISSSVIAVDRVEFSYDPPAHGAFYAQYFPCPVSFGAKHTAMVISGDDLDAPLRSSDPEFNALCLRHCTQIKRSIERSNPMVSRLRSLFLARPGALPTLDDAANHFGVSTRSLRRHLMQQNTSYQHVADEIRLELASEYLRSEHLSAKEVSYLLGFHNVTAFRRAFKSWTGRTVQEFLTD